MNHRQQGVILLMTLLLLGVISALIVAQLEMVLLHQKAHHQFFARQKIRDNLEQLALQMMSFSSYQGQSHCMMMPNQDPNQAIAQLKTHPVCTLTREQKNYIYLIEDLGVEPCLQTWTHDVPLSTRHWRITIRQKEGSNDYLQLRIATLTDYYFCPKQQVLYIIPGIVSWRFGFLGIK